MKRTNYGYETNNYKIVRKISSNIFSCVKSVDGFELVDKKTDKVISFSPWLKDIKNELIRMEEC